MSRARRRRPDVRSAVRRAASRPAVGTGRPDAARTGGTRGGATPVSASPGASRLAFLLDGAAAPSAPPRSTAAEPARAPKPLRVRPAPRAGERPSIGESRPGAGPFDRADRRERGVEAERAPGAGESANHTPVWRTRPTPRYRGDHDERASLLVAETADAWSALPAPLQTALGIAIAIPLATAVALTRIVAGLAGVGRGE